MQNADKICIFPTPIKNPNTKTNGYIYFCKIVNYKNDVFYKIGFSRDISKRMATLKQEHTGNIGTITLLAYGYALNMSETEFHLHQVFFKKGYSFLYSAGIPKWSNEYFDLDYYGVCNVIAEMMKCCFDTKTVVTISNDINLPYHRILPYCTNDLGYWEHRDLKCRFRSCCIGDDCCSYEKCRADFKYSICD